MKPMPIAQYLSRRATATAPDPQREAVGARVIRAFASAPSMVPTNALPASPIQAYARPLNARADGTRAGESRHPDFPPPPPPANDTRDAAHAQAIEARIEEAFARGRQEGLEAAREEATAARNAEIDAMRLSLDEENRQRRQDEMAGLAITLSSTLLDMETRLSASIARVLTPLVAAKFVREMLEEFAQAMEKMRLGTTDAPIVVRGQSYLLAGLRKKIVELGLNVELLVDDGVELVFEVGETSIQSSLQSWMDRISELEG